MAGNVWEWVRGDYHGDYTGASADGSAWVTGGELRVVRGGSWKAPMETLRTSYRESGIKPSVWSNDIGFRCVRSPTIDDTDT